MHLYFGYKGFFCFLAERAAGVCCCSILPAELLPGLPLCSLAAGGHRGLLPLTGSWWGQTINLLSPSGDEDWQLVGDESKVADEKIHPDNCCNCTLRMQLLSQSIRQGLLLNLYLAVNFILCFKSKNFLHEISMEKTILIFFFVLNPIMFSPVDRWIGNSCILKQGSNCDLNIKLPFSVKPFDEYTSCCYFTTNINKQHEWVSIIHNI